MDCEYILVYRTGEGEENEFSYKFHASTPDEARETARIIIKQHQDHNVRERPFAPIVVKGELYRQMVEIDGETLIITTDGRPHTQPIRK